MGTWVWRRFFGFAGRVFEEGYAGAATEVEVGGGDAEAGLEGLVEGLELLALVVGLGGFEGWGVEAEC